MKCFSDMVTVLTFLTIYLFNTGIVSSTPLPLDDQVTNREGKGFLGFTFFAPPAKVEPHQCIATNGLLNIGTCFNKPSCIENGGVESGTCSTGGVCCVFPKVCGGVVARNRTWFVNKDFPGKSRSVGDCVITIKKEFPRVKQVRLDFQSLQLDGPRRGRCLEDALEVSSMKNENGRMQEVESVPKLCGDNTGQHVYVNVEHGDAKVRIKLGSGGPSRGNKDREWRILISQLDDSNLAPTDCLQYYRDTSLNVRSLNYEANENFRDDLNYDICFTKLKRSQNANESCKRRFSNVVIDQTDSFRDQTQRRKKMKSKRRRTGRDVESRELTAHSQLAQSIGDKHMTEAITNVIGQISKTVEELRMEDTPLKDSNLPQLNGMGAIRNDDAPNDDVYPILYSAGNEAVLSQIQQVVLQLQQEQLGLEEMPSFGGSGISNDEDAAISSTGTEAPLEVTTQFSDDKPTSDEEMEMTEVMSTTINPDNSNEEELIENSVNSVSSIVSEFLTNYVTYTTNPPYLITDNLAVEGTMIESTLIPENLPEENATTETPEEVTSVTTDDFTEDTSVSESEAESNSNDDLTASNDNMIINESLSSTESATDQDDLVVTTEGYALAISTTTDEFTIPDDTLMESINKDESESPQAEITVLDPDNVKVQGDLVLKDTNSNDNDEEINSTNLSVVTTESTPEMLNKTMDLVPSTTTTVTTELTTTVTNSEGMNEKLEDEMGKKPIKDNDQKETSTRPQNSDMLSSEVNFSTGDNLENIQWLILDGDSAEEENIVDPTLAIPPEVIISSDLGFGFNDPVKLEHDSTSDDAENNESDNNNNDNTDKNTPTSTSSSGYSPTVSNVEGEESDVNDTNETIAHESGTANDDDQHMNKDETSGDTANDDDQHMNKDETSGDTANDDDQHMNKDETSGDTANDDDQHMNKDETIGDTANDDDQHMNKDETSGDTANDDDQHMNKDETSGDNLDVTTNTTSNTLIHKETEKIAEEQDASLDAVDNDDKTENASNTKDETDMLNKPQPDDNDISDINIMLEDETPSSSSNMEITKESEISDDSTLESEDDTEMETLSGENVTEIDNVVEEENESIAELADNTDETENMTEVGEAIIEASTSDSGDSVGENNITETENNATNENDVVAELDVDSIAGTKDKDKIIADSMTETGDNMAEVEIDTNTMNGEGAGTTSETNISLMAETTVESTAENDTDTMTEVEASSLNDAEADDVEEMEITNTGIVTMTEDEASHASGGEVASENNGLTQTQDHEMEETPTKTDDAQSPEVNKNSSSDLSDMAGGEQALNEANISMLMANTPEEHDENKVDIKIKPIFTPLTESNIESSTSESNIVDIQEEEEEEEEEDEVEIILPELPPPSNEELCGGSFLKVRENVICSEHFRNEAVTDKTFEDERFKDIERISVRAIEDASQSLRFQLQYETECPEERVTTPKPPVRKTVTLLQYLLGWYR